MTYVEYEKIRYQKLNEVKELSRGIMVSSRGFAAESIAKLKAKKILKILAEIEEARKGLPDIEV